MRLGRRTALGAAVGMCALGATAVALASSHREAPFITKNPKVDATDFYLFRSYEPGRDGYVTLIANYQPLQDAYGGPNYFSMDPEALYEIHIDNNGDAVEDLTFQFRFQNQLAGGGGVKLDIGGKMVAVPLVNVGPVSAADTSNLNVRESYTVKLVRGGRRSGNASSVTNAVGGATTFEKPLDYVGTKTFPAPGYAAYANAHIYAINVPGCAAQGKMFVGQRRESFAVNLGTVFDLVNAPPEVIVGGNTPGGRNLAPSTIADKNVTTLALELPISCVKGSGDVIGAWTTASMRQARILNPRATYTRPALEAGAWTQVSRLSSPLVNELVIGLPDKDHFNASEPKDDAQFADYVTNPTLPALIQVLFGSAGVMAPTKLPRTDLVAAFLTGVAGVNANGSTAEMLRLNTALPATPKGAQQSLGAALCFVQGTLTLDNPGCDPAGFPNGRRPGDDTVDIALRVAMGYLLTTADAPSGQLGYTDAVLQSDAQFDAAFPYLTTPMPGAGAQ
ncbi:MAG TPA: DUF4331 domain-containing protein [Haliangiales bacterium]|nr:DUF4331 domain-containing protein [Haliangiales bacterium]